MSETKNLSTRVLVIVLFILGLAAEVFGTEGVTVIGVLVQDSEGALELQTPEFTYFVQGTVPETLVGKPVVLTGRVARGEQGTRWLIVTECTEKIDTANGPGQ